MKTINNIKWMALASLALFSCSSESDVIETPATGLTATAGSANFTKYVALGDSFAAGYSDGALFKAAQETAYPNIIAQQFATAGGGEFKTPLMADNVGGLLLGGNVIADVRRYLNTTLVEPSPDFVSGTPTTVASTVLTGGFNNMGVPGAKSFHLLAPGYGNVANLPANANPYFVRFATAPNKTVLEDAVAQAPTFFSLWIGGNDALGYATTGGDGTNPLTPTATFDGAYNALVNGLTANNAKGVVANLPYVNTLPYFTTVPYNPLTSKILGGGDTAVGDATIAELNTQLYGPLKQILTAIEIAGVSGAGSRINLLSTTTANPLLIKDESLPDLSAQLTAAFTQGGMDAAQAGAMGAIFGKARQATATDLVLLTTKPAIGTAPTAADSGIGTAPAAPLNKFGITYPLQDKHVLIPTELAEIKTATDAYNVTIKAVADAKGLAFVDAKAIMTQLISANGVSANGFTLKATFVTGGAFSLDGVHPSPRGYALIANYFIKAINTKYGSTLKEVDLSAYRILFPATL